MYKQTASQQPTLEEQILEEQTPEELTPEEMLAQILFEDRKISTLMTERKSQIFTLKSGNLGLALSSELHGKKYVELEAQKDNGNYSLTIHELYPREIQGNFSELLTVVSDGLENIGYKTPTFLETHATAFQNITGISLTHLQRRDTHPATLTSPRTQPILLPTAQHIDSKSTIFDVQQLKTKEEHRTL